MSIFYDVLHMFDDTWSDQAAWQLFFGLLLEAIWVQFLHWGTTSATCGATSPAPSSTSLAPFSPSSTCIPRRTSDQIGCVWWFSPGKVYWDDWGNAWCWVHSIITQIMVEDHQVIVQDFASSEVLEFSIQNRKLANIYFWWFLRGTLPRRRSGFPQNSTSHVNNPGQPCYYPSTMPLTASISFPAHVTESFVLKSGSSVLGWFRRASWHQDRLPWSQAREFAAHRPGKG